MKKIIQAIAEISILFLCFSSITVFAQRPGEGVNVVPPPWAPYYEDLNGA